MDKHVYLEGIVAHLSQEGFNGLARNIARLFEMRELARQIDSFKDLPIRGRTIIVSGGMEESLEYVVNDYVINPDEEIGMIIVGSKKFTSAELNVLQNPESWQRGFEDGRAGRENNADSDDYNIGYKRGAEMTRGYGKRK